MTAEELVEPLGVAKTTASSKAAQIRNAVEEENAAIED